MPVPPVPQSAGLLSGWKEISAYLGKGVRTAQRWEHLHGLPIHRIGEGAGEIVFAFRHEIDDWLKSFAGRRASQGAVTTAHPNSTNPAPNTGPPPAPTPPTTPPPTAPTASSSNDPYGIITEVSRPVRRAFALIVVAGGLVLILAASLAWLIASGRANPLTSDDPLTASPAAQPARWNVDNDTLRVYNEAGNELWRHRIGGTVHEESYGPPDGPWIGGATIEDLDGDGPREVLVFALGSEREPRRTLTCLDADGSLRWERRLDDQVVFGGETYRPPWLVYRVQTLPNADGTKSVWAVFIHGMLFPTVLEQIDAQGTVRSRYWSNGYINGLNVATWKQREVLLVAAANNEHKAASLAILDRQDPNGRAPAANPTYSCSSCPPGDPIEFIVFPATPIGRIRNEASTIAEAWIEEGDGLVVRASEPVQGTDLTHPGDLYYTLDSDLRPRSIEFSLNYERLHDWWFKAGRLDRPFSEQEQRRLVPLLRWNGSRYVELHPPRPLP